MNTFCYCPFGTAGRLFVPTLGPTVGREPSSLIPRLTGRGPLQRVDAIDTLETAQSLHNLSVSPYDTRRPALDSALFARAYARVCTNRRHFPPHADIWHLRFHWSTLSPRILQTVNNGQWHLSPLTLVQRVDGTRCAVWSAADAVVLTALTLSITPLLPVSARCEHIGGHGGGKQSVRQAQNAIRRAGYTFVCRTDIRGYYANIQHTLLLTQLRQYINHPVHLDLLSQFLHYTVEDGGHFHSPRKGIPRASALSPLLAAFHLTETDRYFEQQLHLRYARFMDDFLIFARTRHHLRRAVKALNRFLTHYGFVKHPEKTFIGRITKGTDWMGFWLDDKGGSKPAPRAVNTMLHKLRRLYEQTRHLSASQRQGRVAQYLQHWLRWARMSLTISVAIPITPVVVLPCTTQHDIGV